MVWLGAAETVGAWKIDDRPWRMEDGEWADGGWAVDDSWRELELWWWSGLVAGGRN